MFKNVPCNYIDSMKKEVNDVIDISLVRIGKYVTGYFLVKHSHLYNILHVYIIYFIFYIYYMLYIIYIYIIIIYLVY